VKCSEFLHELTNYLDGVIDENTKVELENHLSWCHNCYVVCDTTKKTIEIYRDSQLYELPEASRDFRFIYWQPAAAVSHIMLKRRFGVLHVFLSA
jgi:predicted anti-sigma-YlaC factor YlaD